MPLVVRGRLNPGTNFQALDAGSAQNPSVAFRDSQSTGLFLPGTNSIGITTGGQQTVYSSYTGTLISAPQSNVNITQGNVITHIPYISANVASPTLDSSTYILLEHLDITTLSLNNLSTVAQWGNAIGNTTSYSPPIFKTISHEPLDRHIDLQSSGVAGAYFDLGGRTIDFATQGSFAAAFNIKMPLGTGASQPIFDFRDTQSSDAVRFYRSDTTGNVAFSITAKSATCTVTTASPIITGDWQTIGCRAYRVTPTTWNLSIWSKDLSSVNTTFNVSFDNVVITSSFLARSATQEIFLLGSIREAIWMASIDEISFVNTCLYLVAKYRSVFRSYAKNSSFTVQSNVSYHNSIRCDPTGRVDRITSINGCLLKGVRPWSPPNLLRYSVLDMLAAMTESTSCQPGLDSLVDIPGYVGNFAYHGCVLLSGNRVLQIPHNATSIAVYNATTSIVSYHDATFPGLNAYAGGVLLPNNSVYCIPWAATQARIINTSTMTSSIAAGTFSSVAQFYGGTLLPDGTVFLTPHNSSSALLYDYRTDTATSVAGFPGNGACVGSVLTPSGVVVCIPYNATRARLYNPLTRTVTSSAQTFGSGGGAFFGGVLLPSGEVFCVPHNSSRAAIYDIENDSVRFTSYLFPGSYAFAGGVLLPDGRVACIPWNASLCYIYNPVDDTISTSPYTFSGTSACSGGVLMRTGDVFLSCCNSTRASLLSTGSWGHFRASENLLTSPFMNTF